MIYKLVATNLNYSFLYYLVISVFKYILSYKSYLKYLKKYNVFNIEINEITFNEIKVNKFKVIIFTFCCLSSNKLI